MEQRVTSLIESTVNTLGFDVVKVIIHGTSTKIVEILIERIDGEKVQVNDCQVVSKNISAMLDVEDIISGKYFLEVSSAGVERPLVKITDFDKFAGREIKIRLKAAFNGNLTYKGQLLGVEGEKVKLKSKNIEMFFDYSNIKNAKLVLTDDMFRALLNKKD
ncbi:Ribosome maturation factor RimP [Candidatus Megaera venefica]|jgi:ribosome maturation factor RimP|uniref:Ribosome maturation factor RimP n=1 Tax=Candidatus Megaera venefica TaxID=2055910 RepID=A0ABU5NDW8_9RICK|nr:ribosome maturation factor RimP [Candidatus Megaera venefica]MBY0534105.1 ribosome maturation factor RimP [Rickettsiaceae bacterium]MEA0971350.1 Ribosome maturation factor RimP [Candidatus Megaera venefica]